MTSYRFSNDRKLSALGYLVLVYALKNEGLFKALPEFEYNAHGKPFLTNYRNLYFNISHCSNAVACYLSGTEVGVDVESVGEYDDELAKAICNVDEYQWITDSLDLTQRARKLTQLWTQKESIVKWRGTGINCDPKEIKTGIRPYIHNLDYKLVSHYYRGRNICVSICKQCQ